MDETEQMKKRYRELAERCRTRNQYTITGFLGLAELSEWYETETGLAYVPYELFGGYDGAERVRLRFGSEDMLGYAEPWPISVLHIRPLSEKFSDDLTHRDVLGAMMNLGIERSVLGDIVMDGNNAWALCDSTIVEYIADSLVTIKHTNVSCSVTETLPEVAVPEPEEFSVGVASERIDGMIAAIYKLSRNEAAELFRRKLIFRNGRLCENTSAIVKQGDCVTVRGYGRFTYEGISGQSRKGRLYAQVRIVGRRR